MKRLFAFAFLFACGLVTTAAQEGEPRHWTTSDGVRSTVKLVLIERSGQSVKLRREDNDRVVTMHLSKLSAEDRRYLRNLETPPTPSTTNPAETQTSDWPQWRGARRDGKSSESGLLGEWPGGGPELLWTAQGLGQGYSTPSIAGGRVYVLGTSGNREAVFCLQADSGNQLWSSPLGSIAEGGGFKGPRGATTIDGNRVYAIGSDGTLLCCDAANGRAAWQKNLKRDLGGAHGHWAYAESPLIDGNKLICTPGGNRNTVVALDKSRGNPIWNGSVSELGGDYSVVGYASPIAATISGVAQYIVFISGGVVGLDAETGTPLWHYDSPANTTANCSTPVADGDLVFAASGYGTGGGQARVSRNGRSWQVQETFFERKFENHHGGFVLVDGFVYGTNDSSLLCMDWRSGTIRWQDRSVGKGSVCFADGHLYVRGENGGVALVEASPDGYSEKGRFDQPERSGQRAWAHPVVADGKLYLRDWDKLLCYRIR